MEDDFKIQNKKKTGERNYTIRKMWEIMAQRPSEFDMQVIEALKNTIINDCNTEQIYGCYGEDVYIGIRQQICQYKTKDGIINFLLNDKIITDSSSKTTTKNTHKLIKKSDIIRYEATMKKLNERLNTMLNSFNLSHFNIPSESIIMSNILEIRSLGFIYLAWYITNNKDKYNSDKMIPFSIIVTLQRFIAIISTPETGYTGYNTMNPNESINISKTLIQDLKYIEAKLSKIYNFNGVTLYEQASDLILGSQFDCYLPRKSRKAFEHQIIVSNTLMNIEHLKNGFVMFYRTMTNSGKTSTIINIATAVQELRRKYPNVFGDLQVIACCDVQPVLSRWGQLLYHSGIPFGVGAKRIIPSNTEIARKITTKATKEMADDQDCVDINMRFSNSDTCKSINDRIGIICTSEIALKILTNAPNAKTRFILLHDEPTMFADAIESAGLLINMQVMHNAPKWAIFSSATLPFDAKSAVFIEHHKRTYPNATFIDNCSTEIYSCCNMKTFYKKLITPHLGCKTREELANAIEHIMKNPFLGKLYTPTSVKQLYDEAIEAGNKNATFTQTIPNITEIFSKVQNLYPDNVRKVALDILKAVTLLNNKQIEYICSNEYEEDDDDENEINFANLGTKEAYKFPYLNLIASKTPFEFMQTNYNGLISDIKRKIGSLSKLESDYERAMDSWQNAYDSLEKKIKNSDELSRQQSDMYECKPALAYPEDCQINTKQHIMKYSKHAYNEIGEFGANKFRIPSNLNIDELNDLHITDDTKLQLLSGVCSYIAPCTNIYNIDEDYLSTALNLTSQKKVETMIADSSICYGTDYPIGGVIITKEFSNCHSLNTIYQLMSRAGRGRKSNNAEIYVDDTCARKILDTVKQGINAESIEVDNMIQIFTNL